MCEVSPQILHLGTELMDLLVPVIELGFSFCTESNFSYLLSSELIAEQECDALDSVIDDQKKRVKGTHFWAVGL